MSETPQLGERPERPALHYGAPVFALDWVNDGQPIWPCNDCLPWHVEVIESEEEGATLIREWHAADCDALKPTDDIADL